MSKYSGPARAGSARVANELKCQGPRCGKSLDISNIPVDYRAFLEGVAPLAVACGAWHVAEGETPTKSLAYQSVLKQYDEAFDKGDRITFAVLMAETFSLAAGVDLPICDSCMHSAISAANNAADAAAVERNSAVTALQGLKLKAQHKSAVLEDASSIAALRAELEALDKDEAALLADIDGLEQQLGIAAKQPLPQHQTNTQHITDSSDAEALKAAIEVAAEEALAITKQTAKPSTSTRKQATIPAQKRHLMRLIEEISTVESQAWREYQNVATHLRGARQRMASLVDRNFRYRDLLSRLRYLSVHNDALFIWHRGPFVTINGCRLGRLPGHTVEWPEINAGLGHVATLLSVIANRIGHRFVKYQIIPMGSFSCITPSGDEHTSYELHYSTRYFAQTRLNTALKGMLACIAELGELAQSVDPSFWWPHPISHGGERIADLHITMGGKETQWTRAMKCALTNLKWLLAWAYRQPE